jgi:hypothetical protein
MEANEGKCKVLEQNMPKALLLVLGLGPAGPSTNTSPACSLEVEFQWPIAAPHRPPAKQPMEGGSKGTVGSQKPINICFAERELLFNALFESTSNNNSIANRTNNKPDSSIRRTAHAVNRKCQMWLICRLK